MDLVPHPFLDREAVVVNGITLDGPWLSLLHTQIMWETSNALMLQGPKMWMKSMSLTTSVLFEKRLQDPCLFLSTVSKPPRYNEKKTLFMAVQRPVDELIIPHMFVHTVLTIGIGVLSVLVGRQCSIPTDVSIPVKVFDNLGFGA